MASSDHGAKEPEKEMAYSDDECELALDNVSDYEFVSDTEELISFVKLPVEWNKGETREGTRKPIFLSGKTDNGLRLIYKQVIAWKFDLSYDKPEISVLSAEGNWIKLLKPRNLFQDTIRTIQITVHFLHFAKWNPQRSKKALWDHLNRSFSMFQRRPSEDDLLNHLQFIDEAVKRDETLANSKLLTTCLDESLGKRTFTADVKPSFIVDDTDDNEDLEEFDKIDENGDDESDEDDCFDSVCAICDNGGNLLICDGKCMRSFHATVKDGEESQCESLGFTNEELEELKTVPFYCKNCEYKQHQCFACGELGSSDESSDCEVFCCVNGACGLFYHPHCVAKLLHPGDKSAVEEHRQKIAAGEQFACPAHKCHMCKELEVRSNPDLQFAVCRRCPRAYHKKCLPRGIAFEKDADEDKGIIQRAWEGLIPNRVLVYCLKHEIDPDIFTPVRDHIKFPGPQRKKIKKLQLETSKRKDLVKERNVALEEDDEKKYFAKPPKRADKVSASSKQGDLSKRVEKIPAEGPLKRQKLATNTNSLGKSKESTSAEGEISLGEKLYSRFYGIDSEPVKSSTRGSLPGERKTIQKTKSPAKRIHNSVTLDADARKRILTLMKDASSSITLDQIKERHKSPSTHSQYSKFYADTVTLGKVENAIQSVRAALKKLDEGGTILDAKAVCGDNLLSQVTKWKDKMGVYLSPFLHGMRYTSFGRHFTKIDKLKEIVDMLHWYVHDGDMLVDFCCGSNDFSCLMKKKVDEIGKKCSFKNYDILQPKNDFNFEQRDWMGVRPHELPDGSQLIMGLNPPFGYNAALANKFINKALEFKPKLIILIVPRETERLDKKAYPYNLVWEDDQMFNGRTFYLPGSVDVNDKEIEDWNLIAPVLSLWSRPDLAPKHKAIAEQHGHSSGARKNYRLEESSKEMPVQAIHPDKPENQESSREMHAETVYSDKPENLESSKEMHVQTVHPDKPENQEQEDDAMVASSNQESLPCDGSRGNEGDKNPAEEKNHSEPNSNKFDGKGKRKRQSINLPPEDNLSSSKGSQLRHLSPRVAGGNSLEPYPPKLVRTPSHVHSDYHQPNRSNLHTPHQPYPEAAAYGRNEGAVGNLVRRYAAPSPNPNYGLRREEPNSWSPRPVTPSYPGPGFPSRYGGQHNHPAVIPSYNEMNSTPSTMQRYAPRLDELNHARMNNNRPPPMHDPSVMYRPPGTLGPVPRGGSLGFAQRPYLPHSQHNSSSGWLNE
ncbi:hypothetical protein ABFS82_13G162700 [Erythranthe guttata]|nr:PREDICTED: protein ENHANCED DOWNY MILDEW 2 [Erythranthe guttata]|eukprot:XP_012848862.1 PREDICTED: protein ENHANCED DOWNY MILDEW 2 [Erythranthe guttata]